MAEPLTADEQEKLQRLLVRWWAAPDPQAQASAEGHLLRMLVNAKGLDRLLAQVEAQEVRIAALEAVAQAANRQEMRLVTVCARCFLASCWQGIHMCQEAYRAGTLDVPVYELQRLNREHPCYWEPREVTRGKTDIKPMEGGGQGG